MAQEPPPRSTPLARVPPHRHQDAIMVLMNLMFARHLLNVRSAFHGDLVAAIVLAEIAHHNLAPLVNRARTPHELSEILRTDTDKLPQILLPTNAFSIAQATGIPRETVRRKVAHLVRRGWVDRDTEGNLSVTSHPVVEFAAFNEERLGDLLDTARAIGELLDERKPAVSDRPASGRPKPPHRANASS